MPLLKADVQSTSEGPVHRSALCLQQENVIQTMELRNYFSLYCLHQETQLVHVYLPLTSHILGAFVNSQIQGHKEVSHPCPCRHYWHPVFSCLAFSLQPVTPRLELIPSSLTLVLPASCVARMAAPETCEQDWKDIRMLVLSEELQEPGEACRL